MIPLPSWTVMVWLAVVPGRVSTLPLGQVISIALTVVAGPLNYAGANPKVADCNVNVPQPSQ